MHKKILIVLIVLASLMLLYSCNEKSDFMFNEEIIDMNINLNPRELDYDEPIIIINDLDDLTVTNYKYLNQGILFVKDGDERVGVWNLFENKLILPLEADLTIEYIYDWYFGCYFKSVSKDNKTTIYDINGNIVLPRGDYSYVDIRTTRKLKEPKLEASGLDFQPMFSPAFEDNVLLYDYYEIIDYVVNDTKERIQKKNKVDRVLKTREVVETNIDVFEKDYNKTDLKECGLDGYYKISKLPNVYIYKNDGKLVNKITIEESSDNGCFDGKIFIQKMYNVLDESYDYDYEYNNSKLKIVSKTIDLLTGKVKELDLDYIIESRSYGNSFNRGVEKYLDSNGYPKYGFARVKPINNKYLLEETNVIINSSGEILANLGNIYPKRLIKLEDELYYNSMDKYFYNSSLEPLFGINGYEKILENSKLIILMVKGKYGVIDYEGNVVIPFEYSYIGDAMGNYFYAIDNNSKPCIINLNNEKRYLHNNDIFVLSGLTFKYTYNSLTSEATGNFISYEGNIKASIDYISDEGVPVFQDVSNGFNDGKLMIIHTNLEKLEYVVIKNRIKGS